jgi:hypothetical protein
MTSTWRNVATAVSKTQIGLAWTDNASNKTGFKIERCAGANCTNFTQIATVGVNVKNYSNTTYLYRVRAFNSSGNSSYSNTAGVTTARWIIGDPLGNGDAIAAAPN